MDALLTAIVLWISANFDLPANYQHPQITIVPATAISAMHYRNAVPGKTREAMRGTAPASALHADIVAVYNTRTKTIYLADGWTGRTPAELSILVHEMIHHLQTMAGMTFACPEEREKMAFAAQEQWLRIFGLDLKGEFGLDPFTLLVKTSCPR
jgi:hypothetical protein